MSLERAKLFWFELGVVASSVVDSVIKVFMVASVSDPGVTG